MTLLGSCVDHQRRLLKCSFLEPHYGNSELVSKRVVHQSGFDKLPELSWPAVEG